MKVEYKNNVKGMNSQDLISFKIGDEKVIFSILTESLYSNPIKSIVREYLANALDSHKAINSNDKIEINLTEKQFTIRDYGKSLNDEELVDLFCTLGNSDKRHTDALIGGYGIGAKVGFAYCSQFLIQRYYNNIKTSYSASIVNGLPHLIKINEIKTDEKNGMKIIIPIATYNDYINFKDYIVYYCSPLRDKVKTNVQLAETIYEDNDVIVCHYNSFKDHTSIMLGDIAYTCPIRLHGLVKFYNYTRFHMYLKFKINDFKVNTSREDIIVDKEDKVVNKYNKVIDKLLKYALNNRSSLKYEMYFYVNNDEISVSKSSVRINGFNNLGAIDYRYNKLQYRRNEHVYFKDKLLVFKAKNEDICITKLTKKFTRAQLAYIKHIMNKYDTYTAFIVNDENKIPEVFKPYARLIDLDSDDVEQFKTSRKRTNNYYMYAKTKILIKESTVDSLQDTLVIYTHKTVEQNLFNLSMVCRPLIKILNVEKIAFVRLPKRTYTYLKSKNIKLIPLEEFYQTLCKYVCIAGHVYCSYACKGHNVKIYSYDERDKYEHEQLLLDFFNNCRSYSTVIFQLDRFIRKDNQNLPSIYNSYAYYNNRRYHLRKLYDKIVQTNELPYTINSFFVFCKVDLKNVIQKELHIQRLNGLAY